MDRNVLFFKTLVKLLVRTHKANKKSGSSYIGGEALNWIRAWLTDRKQKVNIYGVKLELGPVMISGMPQGSLLGPVSVVMYINDPDRGVGSVRKFAVDR